MNTLGCLYKGLPRCISSQELCQEQIHMIVPGCERYSLAQEQVWESVYNAYWINVLWYIQNYEYPQMRKKVCANIEMGHYHYLDVKEFMTPYIAWIRCIITSFTVISIPMETFLSWSDQWVNACHYILHAIPKLLGTFEYWLSVAVNMSLKSQSFQSDRNHGSQTRDIFPDMRYFSRLLKNSWLTSGCQECNNL